MKVAFGTTVLANGLRGTGVDGIGTYTRELMAHMPPSVTLVPYSFGLSHSFGPSHGASIDAGSFTKQGLTSLTLGKEFSEAKRAIKHSDAGHIDLVHATDHMVPKLRGTPVVATLFDAIPLSNPEWVTYRFKTIKNELWRRTAFWADHIITISEYARQQIAEHFRLPLGRITAIPLGVGPQWFLPVSDTEWLRVQQQYSLPTQYFVSVGTLQPRKNIGRLLAAHAALPLDVQKQFPLIILGKDGWGCEEEVAQLRSGKLAHVRWLGHVTDDVVQVVVKRARALVFPSLMEGFGLPVVEAFAAGVPVVASKTTSIPEVAGDAAILVDPLRIDDISQGMLDVAINAEISAKRISLGRNRVDQFSWVACAEETAMVYRQYVDR